jgi:hypothetical protein
MTLLFGGPLVRLGPTLVARVVFSPLKLGVGGGVAARFLNNIRPKLPLARPLFSRARPPPP